MTSSSSAAAAAAAAAQPLTSITNAPSSSAYYWTLGVYRNGDTVFWQQFTSEDVAREEAVSLLHPRRDALVLFDIDEVPAIYSSYYSFSDVGMILHAYVTQRDDSGSSSSSTNNINNGDVMALSPPLWVSTKVDRAKVEELISQGDLPSVPTDRSALVQRGLMAAMNMVFNRHTVRFFACSPLRFGKTLYYFDADHNKYPRMRGHVALTIDDAPCRMGKKSSRLLEVQELLQRHNATATFMVVGKFMEGHEEDLAGLIQSGGHELGNHGMLDRPYDKDTPEQFAAAVEECNARIKSVQQRANVTQEVKWYRAPHGKYTKAMEQALTERNLRNVMCDTYASCAVVQDGTYIGQALAKNARDGSILLLHMPERGFRDYTMVALRHLLDGLKQRGLKVVTVSELERLQS